MGDLDPQRSIESDPLLKAVLIEILRIQPNFNAEPFFAMTGRGHMRSEGVLQLQELKRLAKQGGEGSDS